MKFCKDCWNFSRCNAEGRTVEFAVDDGVCCEFDEVKNMTNADRIRAMTDEELVLFVRAFINSSRCPYDWKGCENCWLKELCNANAYNGELEWLHTPAEGE